MCIKLFGVVYILSSIAVDECDAGRSRSINVTKEICGTKYNMSADDRLRLAYDGEKDFENLHPPCVLTMVNIVPGFEICVQLAVNTNYIYVDTVSCRLSFKYFIGYLPKSLRYGDSCVSFKRKPLCTEKSNVYAVFVDEILFYALDPFEIEIFTRMKPTTTTERWTTPYQTVYGFTAKPKHAMSSTAVTLLVVAGLVVLTIVCVCCNLSHIKSRQANASQSLAETEHQNIPLSNDRYNEQTNMRDTYQPTRQINEAPAPRTFYNDAPSYEDVVLPSAPVLSESNEPNDISTPDRRSPSPYFNQSNGSSSSPQDESDSSTSIGSDRPTTNEEVPSVPPPKYEDLDLPPPYPGL
ncbi:hypothetical protein ACF0H5_005373 [Mactra antiquata]